LIDQIITIGHSIGDVDLPYFREIMGNIDADGVKWKVSYHGNPLGVQQQMTKLGVDPSLIEFVRANEL
jgi:hypothetical protein